MVTNSFMKTFVLCSFRTKKITITNFCLGKHLIREDDLLRDQRGSPAYISPDVLSGLFLHIFNFK